MVKSKHHKFLLIWTIGLAGLLGATTETYAQAGAKVISVKKREKTLHLGETYLNLKNPEQYASFSELNYPFSFLPPEEEVEVVPEATPEVVEAPVEKEPEIVLTDREVLEDVAANMNPTGTLERAGKTYLVFAKGQIPDGGSIKLNYKGKPYMIRITDVADTGYNLVLNDETIYKTLGGSGKGTIQRDEN
ncbi:hypothetical protein [Rubellicoccus peritrichatus]|uniref:Uncharacterized protein n=1 Tax=Rubellicoccus peritrichatus TaxID=3080537 RepID=A0AAQ3LBP1_9BACT|nr:hypothetical protein [Puniceicoccus sp. CR14]WOO41407.1 hypothetical protein RZN69_22535 [Puniceicoccus sp. CR14]